MRILVVDSQAAVKELSIWLSGAHSLVGMEHAQEAIEELKKKSVGLVIAGTLDLLSASKSLMPTVPFFFCTQDLLAAREALNLGADEYLLRPYHATEVLGRVSRINSMPLAQKGLEEILLERERDIVMTAMKEARFRQVKAAELLKITRGALQYKLKKHGYYEEGEEKAPTVAPDGDKKKAA